MCMIIGLCGFIIGMAISDFLIAKKYQKSLIELENKGKDIEEKWSEFYDVLNMWVEIYHKNRSIENYFIKKSIKTIAIYGMKELGQHLMDDLQNSTVSVKYIIDKNKIVNNTNLTVIHPDEELLPVDAIIVTAIHYYAEIEEQLSVKVSIPIINLQDIIYETLYDE